MKNADQIRQFIRNWQTEAGKYITKTKFEAVLVDVINTKCDSLLALLPCSTCNGTEEKWVGHGHTRHQITCPDCQPKSCVCCEEVTEENAHLHRNCGK